MNHKTLIAGSMVAAFAALSLPSFADIFVSIAPPARRVEHMEARAGYIIVPGSWQWTRGKHQWVAGRYVAERPGYRYENDRWVQNSHNKWTMQHGGWSQDSDHDGTPDRADNHPNDPHRR
jgi:WXXGXW repeat (2 copies)